MVSRKEGGRRIPATAKSGITTSGRIGPADPGGEESDRSMAWTIPLNDESKINGAALAAEFSSHRCQKPYPGVFDIEQAQRPTGKPVGEASAR
jgi:hypothetical protein